MPWAGIPSTRSGFSTIQPGLEPLFILQQKHKTSIQDANWRHRTSTSYHVTLQQHLTRHRPATCWSGMVKVKASLWLFQYVTLGPFLAVPSLHGQHAGVTGWRWMDNSLSCLAQTHHINRVSRLSQICLMHSTSWPKNLDPCHISIAAVEISTHEWGIRNCYQRIPRRQLAVDPTFRQQHRCFLAPKDICTLFS